jgi:glutathione synthase/RimK-type ligase-like ATP-grasp enzyme
MHSLEFIKLINDASAQLGIDVKHLSTNWAIKLEKNGASKFIVGNTFPLNDSACFKIARSKDLCSEILSSNAVKNVPHELLFSPTVLLRRKNTGGNLSVLENFIKKNGFPFLIKRNNSSRGDGVFLVNNETEAENILGTLYTTDSTICLSPFRKINSEYRNVVLKGECLLSFEKQRPYVTGDGISTTIQLISNYLDRYKGNYLKYPRLFQESLLDKLTMIPSNGEKLFLQWKHNASFGVTYEVVDHKDVNDLAILAAKSINGKFVTVDIVHSDTHGYEVLEINASVVLNTFSSLSQTNYQMALSIFKKALAEVFNETNGFI